MRKLSDQVTRDDTTEMPAGRFTELHHMVEQVRPPGDLRVPVEEVPSRVPDPREVIAQRQLARVVPPEHEGAAEIGFPFLEDRSEVDEHDVVVGDGEVGWIAARGLQRVLPPARTMRLCQCLVTPSSSAARSRISSDSSRSVIPARTIRRALIASNSSAALSWASSNRVARVRSSTASA